MGHICVIWVFYNRADSTQLLCFIQTLTSSIEKEKENIKTSTITTGIPEFQKL